MTSSGSEVLLKKESQSEALGADAKEVVVQRFLSILSPETFPERKVPFSIDEKQYISFIALFEHHTFGYARQTISGVELHFRSKNNEPITTVELSLEECEQWRQDLMQWMEKDAEN